PVVDEPFVDVAELASEAIDASSLSRQARVGVALDGMEEPSVSAFDQSGVSASFAMVDHEDHARSDEPRIVGRLAREEASRARTHRPVTVIEAPGGPDHRVLAPQRTGGLVERPVDERRAPRLALGGQIEGNTDPA